MCWVFLCGNLNVKFTKSLYLYNITPWDRTQNLGLIRLPYSWETYWKTKTKKTTTVQISLISWTCWYFLIIDYLVSDVNSVEVILYVFCNNLSSVSFLTIKYSLIRKMETYCIIIDACFLLSVVSVASYLLPTVVASFFWVSSNVPVCLSLCPPLTLT